MVPRLSQHVGISTCGPFVWIFCAILVLVVSELCVSNVDFHSLIGIVYRFHQLESASPTEATIRRTTLQNVGTENKQHHDIRTPSIVHSLCLCVYVCVCVSVCLYVCM